MATRAASRAPVVIIGAGIAGLTAARNLSRAQIPVVILEAQSRVGGRVLTTEDGYDLGASWIHDVEHNELFPVAQQLGASLAYDQKLFFYDNGSRVAEDTIYRTSQLLETAITASPAENLHDWVVSSTQHISDRQERQLVQKAAQAMEHWSGQSWFEMIAQEAAPHFGSPDAFNLSGNGIFVDWLMREIDWKHAKLFTESPLRRISQAATGSYNLELENAETIAAEFVVCTIPIGAIKETKPFDLALPPLLAKALNDSTMASLGKVVLEFDTRWWDNVPDRMEVFSHSDPEKPRVEAARPILPGDEPVFFTNAYKRSGKFALVALTSGALTQFVEANPEQAVRMLMPALEQIRSKPLQKEPVPAPKKVVVTNWTQNRFFRGSYSGSAVGQDFDKIVAAFEAGADQLRFAGEHTTEHGAGCMHGAYYSGQREAAWILAQIEKSRL